MMTFRQAVRETMTDARAEQTLENAKDGAKVLTSELASDEWGTLDGL